MGESDLAAADVEAAKTDAETAAKNRIADQLKTKVSRLTERLSNAAKDLANGAVYGQRTVKDINQNFTEQELVGLRYISYFYYPTRMKPEKIWVRASLKVDNAKISQGIVDAMMAAAKADNLEMDHEEAMQHFEKVRQQYLNENE